MAKALIIIAFAFTGRIIFYLSLILTYYKLFSVGNIDAGT